MKFSKRSLGQNFLIDKNIIKKIVNLVKIKNKNIIEIGPGYGALTDEILNRKPRLVSIIEKDFALYQNLKLKYSKTKNIKIYNNDILNFDLEKIVKKNSIIFGNLPYNISSQILVKILKFKKWPPYFENLVFMFQKELGEKITGNFSSTNYGRLSILSNYRLRFIDKFLVSNNCFSPKPKITSMVILFKPIENKKFKIKNLVNLEKITNKFFSNKRKMINKNIQKILKKSEINTINDLNLSYRPSDLKPETYYQITELFEKK